MNRFVAKISQEYERDYTFEENTHTLKILKTCFGYPVSIISLRMLSRDKDSIQKVIENCNTSKT